MRDGELAGLSGLMLVSAPFRGDILCLAEGLSFWGGVDPGTGQIIDVHHPNSGEAIRGKVLLMPTSRGSCSGSGVLLELALNGCAPTALIFCEDEEVLTLGALIADRIFGHTIPVLRLSPTAYDILARSESVGQTDGVLDWQAGQLTLARVDGQSLALSDRDRAVLDGAEGDAARTAMEILCLMGVLQGAAGLMDVTRGHIDGCILAHSANLIFAERLAEMGARVKIPTTINAISVDREGWRGRGVAEAFGDRASRLADAYVSMGARPTFTCAPYLLTDAPEPGECIGWSESNAVIYANSVIGARTAKHPDYLDLCVAMTGRAPVSGVYTDAGRIAQRVIEVAPLPTGHDEQVWPLLGWLAGRLSPDRVPLLRGLEDAPATPEDMKALCAAFGTTSGAHMLHIAGHTPEAHLPPADDADHVTCTVANLAEAWRELNEPETGIDLVAIGSPHVSIAEIRQLAALFGTQRAHAETDVIVTIGRDALESVRSEDLAAPLEAAGVQFVPDICWCSITEPVFPARTRVLMTNSGKYAHYAHGLSGRAVRFGSLADCVSAALTGHAPVAPPAWLSRDAF